MTIIKRGPNDPPSKIGQAFSPFTETKEEVTKEAIGGIPGIETPAPVVNQMNEARKKIIGAGILIICIASMVHASNERESPSVGWMLALCGTWALGVWLWPEKYARVPRVDWQNMKRKAHVCTIWIVSIGGFIGAIWLFGQSKIFKETKPRDYAKEVMSMDNRYMLEQERSRRIQAQELNNNLHQAHPELGPAPVIPKGPYEKMDEILKGR